MSQRSTSGRTKRPERDFSSSESRNPTVKHKQEPLKGDSRLKVTSNSHERSPSSGRGERQHKSVDSNNYRPFNRRKDKNEPVGFRKRDVERGGGGPRSGGRISLPDSKVPQSETLTSTQQTGGSGFTREFVASDMKKPSQGVSSFYFCIPPCLSINT